MEGAVPGRVTEMPATAQPKRAASSNVLAFGEGDGEASVEGVACAGGFDDGAGVEGGDVGGSCAFLTKAP